MKFGWYSVHRIPDGGQQIGEFLIGRQLRIIGLDLVGALEQETRLAGLDHAQVIEAVPGSNGVIADGLERLYRGQLGLGGSAS